MKPTVRLLLATKHHCSITRLTTHVRHFGSIGTDLPPAGDSSREQRQPNPHVRPRKPPRLTGKSAIVTGGSRGIGFSVASRLAMEGVACTLVGRDEAMLKRAVEALPPLVAAKPLGLPTLNSEAVAAEESALLTKPSQHQYMVGDVREATTWGALFAHAPNTDFLVNAAGIAQNTVLARLTPADIRDILDVNLLGTTLGCRSAMRAWMKNRTSNRCILNVSSVLAIRGGYGTAAYAASKAGVIGLTRAVAEEGGARRIRANVILPGFIDTQMTANMPETQRIETIGRIPLKRLGRAEEVADAALFLLKNEYANNCVLTLDGGLSAAL